MKDKITLRPTLSGFAVLAVVSVVGSLVFMSDDTMRALNSAFSSSQATDSKRYLPDPDIEIITGSIAAQKNHEAAISGKNLTKREVNFTTHPIRLEKIKDGLQALDSGNLAQARLIRDNADSNSLDKKIMSWAIASSGNRSVTSAEILETSKLIADWPGANALRQNIERAMFNEESGPRFVLQTFQASPPQTTQGVMLFSRAHLAVGDTDSARKVLSDFWRTERLSAADEQSIIREFGTVLSQADHRFRMERMLYIDRIASAQRVASLANAQELANAFAAVTRNEKNAAQLLAAVPEAQHSAAFTFAQTRHLRRTGEYRKAADVMLKAPQDAASLVNPDAWWIERRVLSRELLDIGDPQTAYTLAAAHSAESPVHAADAEFHAGWYAFRGLSDTQKGAQHFARIVEISNGAISLSRAYYWLGRVAEAGGPGDAQAFYKKAAQYNTAFYGQLAAAKIDNQSQNSGVPSPTDEDRLAFVARPAVKAIYYLEQAGFPNHAERLYRALAEDLDSVGEIALLAQMAEKKGNHFLSLRIGKWAASQGLPVGTLAYPVGAIPENADISGAGKALAYAIARQESEFNSAARSGAGALGLLQLLPSTAQEMARKAGMDWSQVRLTTDAGYNATLGSFYLDEQLARFAGSYVLTFAGYNAGPRRAQEWVQRYGDPRGQPIETVVDWIERIPFTETRSYVQRVMENYQVYKMQLSGNMAITQDLMQGR